MDLGTSVRQHRLARGLSQMRLAEQVGVSHSYISRLEAGHFAHPSAAIVLRLARALDLPMGDLWAGAALPAELAAGDRMTLDDLRTELLHIGQSLAAVHGLRIEEPHTAQAHSEVSGQPLKHLMLEDAHVPPVRWALHVMDDMLVTEGIHAGDYLVVDPEWPMQLGMLVVTRGIQGYQTMRHTSDNPMDPAQIVGCVYAIIRLLAMQHPAEPVPSTGRTRW